ncbi:spore protease YyaC [Polycladomyces sp. WAk]|uniref:Spore protease YyaC n=1 Tax=Polycladomyces zharkentensis TaxID=2807616 RepID=A0ABS2WF54_9BACL|nr:spore protease YyaC [Polycladomyces sp. WAk]MBN2908161.1 spore protease YyaC [Polycladomyces sp. WAk]
MRELVPRPGSPYSYPYRVQYTQPYAAQECAERLHQVLRTSGSFTHLACVCIGTDRSTGDALGPLVGTLLEKHAPPSLHIFGTLDEPVHAVNLRSTLFRIHQELPHPFIIAVDACLGQLKSVGWIQLGLGPLKPGAGVNKNLPEVGQVHVTGIVNVAGFMEYFVLQNTRLGVVMKMAEVIADAVQLAVRQYHTLPR